MHFYVWWMGLENTGPTGEEQKDAFTNQARLLRFSISWKGPDLQMTYLNPTNRPILPRPRAALTITLDCPLEEDGGTEVTLEEAASRAVTLSILRDMFSSSYSSHGRMEFSDWLDMLSVERR
jgi:hypothetical protein